MGDVEVTLSIHMPHDGRFPFPWVCGFIRSSSTHFLWQRRIFWQNHSEISAHFNPQRQSPSWECYKDVALRQQCRQAVNRNSVSGPLWHPFVEAVACGDLRTCLLKCAIKTNIYLYDFIPFLPFFPTGRKLEKVEVATQRKCRRSSLTLKWHFLRSRPKKWILSSPVLSFLANRHPNSSPRWAHHTRLYMHIAAWANHPSTAPFYKQSVRQWVCLCHCFCPINLMWGSACWNEEIRQHQMETLTVCMQIMFYTNFFFKIFASKEQAKMQTQALLVRSMKASFHWLVIVPRH